MNLQRLHRCLSESLADYLSEKMGEFAPSEQELAAFLAVTMEEKWALDLHRLQSIEKRRLAHRHRLQWKRGRVTVERLLSAES